MNEFKYRVAFLTALSAVILPLIMMPDDLIMYGVFMGLFIVMQALILLLFYKEENLTTKTWLGLWTGIMGLLFLLVLLIAGRQIWVEAVSMLLFAFYVVVFIYLVFSEKIRDNTRRLKQKIKRRKTKKQKNVHSSNYQLLREKDELDDLIDSFRDSVVKRKKETPDQEYESYEEQNDFKVSDEEYDFEDLLSYDKSEKSDKLELPDFEYGEDQIKETSPITPFFDVGEPPEPIIEEKKPKIDLEKMKKDIEVIDEGVKTLTDKIKLISEKAILEGAEKRLEEAEKKRTAAKKVFRKAKDNTVFASKSGTKYHYDKACVSLKRVSKKNIIAYDDGRAASRKGLTACGMCKR